MTRRLAIIPGEYIITNLGLSNNSVSIFITQDKKSIQAAILNVSIVQQYLVCAHYPSIGIVVTLMETCMQPSGTSNLTVTVIGPF